MLTERDMVNPDGSLNWQAIRRIATLRTLVEYDADIVQRLYGPVLRLPAGVSQDNVNEWKHDLAVKALQDNPALEHTPYIEIYKRELRRTLDLARSIRAGLRLREQTIAAKVVSLPRLRLINQLVGSVKEIA